MEFIEFGLQRLEVADGVLEGGVGAEGLQLHQVAADVVQTHVGEAASVAEGKRILVGNGKDPPDIRRCSSL